MAVFSNFISKSRVINRHWRYYYHRLRPGEQNVEYCASIECYASQCVAWTTTDQIQRPGQRSNCQKMEKVQKSRLSYRSPFFLNGFSLFSRKYFHVKVPMLPVAPAADIRMERAVFMSNTSYRSKFLCKGPVSMKRQAEWRRRRW